MCSSITIKCLPAGLDVPAGIFWKQVVKLGFIGEFEGFVCIPAKFQFIDPI